MFQGFEELRRRWDLPCPGPFDNLHRETKSVMPTLHLIEGAKLEASSILSPYFHVTHSLTFGNAQYPPMYHFGAGFQKNQTMMSAQVDHDGNVQGRAHYQWLTADAFPEPTQKPGTPEYEQEKQQIQQQAMLQMMNPYKQSIKTKVEMQLSKSAQHTLASFEHEHIDKEFAFALKAINPQPFDRRGKYGYGTGMYSVSWLGSVSRTLALGGEVALQKPTGDIQETSYSLAMRYAPVPKKLDLPPNFPQNMQSPFPPMDPTQPTEIFALSLTPSTGMLHASFWKKLNQRLDVAAELQTLTSMGSKKTGSFGRREGVASIGFKLQTVYSLVRGMVDSHGKVSGTADYTLAPGLVFQISAEMDYMKQQGGQGRVGLGFQLEA